MATELAVFTSVFGISAIAYGIASSALGLAASQQSMSEVKIDSSFIPRKPLNGTIVRLGVGINPVKLSQGELPTLVAFNENKEVIGHSRINASGSIQSGSLIDVRIEHEEWAINQQTTHLQVIAGDIGFCVAYVLLNMADSTKRGWLGDMGRACGYDWGYSNIAIGDDGYKPTCTWIQKTHDQGVYTAGLQIDIDTFTSQNETPPESLEYFCNSSRMLFMDEPDYSFKKSNGDQTPAKFPYWKGQKKPHPVPIPVRKSSTRPVTATPSGKKPPPTLAQTNKTTTTITSQATIHHPTSLPSPSPLQCQRQFQYPTNNYDLYGSNLIFEDHDEDDDTTNTSYNDEASSRESQQYHHLDHFSNSSVVKIKHPIYSARYACLTRGYTGPSVISPHEGLFCDSRTKIFYPLCGCEGYRETEEEREGDWVDAGIVLNGERCFDEAFGGLRRVVVVVDDKLEPESTLVGNGVEGGKENGVAEQQHQRRRRGKRGIKKEEEGRRRLAGPVREADISTRRIRGRQDGDEH